MGFLKNWQGSRGIMRLMIIQLICWIVWLSNFAFAQLHISEGVTGSLNFPALGITCVANLAVFFTSLIRGRPDFEMGASDLLQILVSPKLKNIEGIGDGNGVTTGRGRGRVTEAAVVMLSNSRPNWSMRQFMKSNSPFVRSILLQFLPLNDAAVTVEVCEGRSHVCDCIVIWTVEEITSKLARRMPQTLKRVSDFLCLLPCRHCLGNVCHGCNQESLLSGADYEKQGFTRCVVSDILGDIHTGSIRAWEPICICIPMNDAHRDDWTKLLVRSLRSKDGEGRGVRVMALEALEGYLAGDRGGRLEGTLKYSTSSFIVPRLAEVLINLVLTFWFRVDGFSSALLARLAVKDYMVNSNGSGVAGNAFLTEAKVMSNDNNTEVCQVLSFRGNLLWMIAFISTVNLISFLGWAVLISFEGGADSPPPKGVGRWLYGALQILVWVTWVAGSLLLNEEISGEFCERKWGILTYCSAFMLNAVLAGVRCKWEPWPWKDNHLFSRKLRH